MPHHQRPAPIHVPAGTWAKLPLSGDDASKEVPLTVGFPFYCHNYTAGSSMWVSTNGFITFDPERSTSHQNFYDFYLPSGGVAPFW